MAPHSAHIIISLRLFPSENTIVCWKIVGKIFGMHWKVWKIQNSGIAQGKEPKLLPITLVPLSFHSASYKFRSFLLRELVLIVCPCRQDTLIAAL